jgi:hypothetical protein
VPLFSSIEAVLKQTVIVGQRLTNRFPILGRQLEARWSTIGKGLIATAQAIRDGISQASVRHDHLRVAIVRIDCELSRSTEESHAQIDHRSSISP